MDSFLQSSLLVLNLEPNATNTLFFSKGNVSKIQNQLIMQTKKYTGYTISNQNCSDILTPMQYFYLNYPQLSISNNVISNVDNLNNLVIIDLTKQIVTGVKQHIEYLKYIKKPLEPLEYGRSTGIKGNNSF